MLRVRFNASLQYRPKMEDGSDVFMTVAFSGGPPDSDN